MPGEGDEQKAKTAAAVKAIVKLGVLALPGRDARLEEYREALVDLAARRDRLVPIIARFIERVSIAKQEAAAAEGVVTLKLDELLVNDAHVRSARDATERKCRARLAAKAELEEAARKNAAVVRWTGMLEICAAVDQKLTVGKETVSKLVSIKELELAAAGFPLGRGRRPGG